MEHQFWQEKWKKNEIGFHEAKPNELLVTHCQALDLQTGDKVFVPLCGKTLDMDWLVEQGFEVFGIELNQGAVEEVFERNGLEPEITKTESHLIYKAGSFELVVGDFFKLTREALSDVAAVYDRAALVALPEGMREDYAAHIADISGDAKQLLISFDYDQSIRRGPPFAIPQQIIEELYGDSYTIKLQDRQEIVGRMPSGAMALEEIWLLVPK